jgi:hypothetical protein
LGGKAHYVQTRLYRRSERLAKPSRFARFQRILIVSALSLAKINLGQVTGRPDSSPYHSITGISFDRADGRHDLERKKIERQFPEILPQISWIHSQSPMGSSEDTNQPSNRLNYAETQTPLHMNRSVSNT